jgi:hypothetical protein
VRVPGVTPAKGGAPRPHVPGPAVAAGGLVLVAALAFLFYGTGKSEKGGPPETERPPTGSVAGSGSSDRERAAEAAILKAQDAAAAGRDLDAQILLWDEAVKVSAGSPRSQEALRERTLLLARRRETCTRELSQLEESIHTLEGSGEFRKAIDFLTSARNRHGYPEWTLGVDRHLARAVEKQKAAEAAETGSRASSSVPHEGLALWLRSDAGITLNGSRVSRWIDQSESRHDASQEVPTHQPSLLSTAVNGRPGLCFDGSQTSMTFHLPVNGLAGMTVFLVSACARDVAQGSGSDAAALYWDASGANGKIYLGSFQTRIRFKFGTGKLNSDLSWTRPSSILIQPSLTVIKMEGRVDSLYTDGRLAVSQTCEGRSIAECKDQAFLGIGKNNSHFSGSIAELLIFTQALGDPVRQRVEHYLMEKYTLPAK